LRNLAWGFEVHSSIKTGPREGATESPGIQEHSADGFGDEFAGGVLTHVRPAIIRHHHFGGQSRGRDPNATKMNAALTCKNLPALEDLLVNRLTTSP
jgi:hypothetical protein